MTTDYVMEILMAFAMIGGLIAICTEAFRGHKVVRYLKYVAGGLTLVAVVLMTMALTARDDVRDAAAEVEAAASVTKTAAEAMEMTRNAGQISKAHEGLPGDL